MKIRDIRIGEWKSYKRMVSATVYGEKFSFMHQCKGVELADKATLRQAIFSGKTHRELMHDDESLVWARSVFGPEMERWAWEVKLVKEKVTGTWQELQLFHVRVMFKEARDFAMFKLTYMDNDAE